MAVKYVCKITVKFIEPFSRKAEIRKQVHRQEQHQSGVSYRAGIKIDRRNNQNWTAEKQRNKFFYIFEIRSIASVLKTS